ncbi:MAG: hypothetical protein EP319_17780 [Deltaproteobacteria bacterium]|nr:MAG: hypothetical protein EP319_17780 [Deltaproteobacteria bacterium]
MKNQDIYFGNVIGMKPVSGIKKRNEGFPQIGYLQPTKGNVYDTYLLLPTGAKLYGQQTDEGKFNVRHFVSHSGFRIDSAFEQRFQSFSWGDVKAYQPTTNTLAPQILVTRFKNGDLYIGEGKGYKAYGFGYLKKQDGMEVWGWFKNNSLHGDALEQRSDRNLYAGSYKNGKRDGIFYHTGYVPSYKFTKNLNLAKFQSIDQQFQELERWYYENKGKEENLAEAPFKEDYALNVNVDEILNYKLEYDSKAERPWQLLITDNTIKNYFRGLNAEVYYLGQHFGATSPGHSTMIKDLPSKNYFLAGDIYKNGKKTGVFKSQKLSLCKIHLKDFNFGDLNSKRPISFFAENCQNGSQSFSSSVMVNQSMSVAIFNAKVVNGQLVTGDSHIYDYSKTGFIGKIADGKYQGDVKFIRTRMDGDKYQTFVNGKSHGLLEIPGFYQIENKNGLAQGRGSFYENGYLYTGKYINGFRVGKFSFTNIFKNTNGSVYFNNKGLRHGEFEEKDQNGRIQQKYSYVNGRKSGKGICFYEKTSEACEFRDDKRIDTLWTKRQQRIEQDREQAKRWLEDYYARKKLEEEEERKKKAAYEEKRRREDEIQARIQRSAREYDEQQFRNQYQQILQNQRNYTNFYSNFTNTGSGVPSVPAVSSKPAQRQSGGSFSSGGSIKLKKQKIYKRCELTQNYEGQRFATYYDCNDQEATLPSARKELQRKITHYADTIRIQKERQAKAKREDIQFQDKRNDACVRHLSRGGNVCDKVCAGSEQAKNQKCKAGAL